MSGSMATRKKQLRKKLDHLRPHLVSDADASNLVVAGSCLFEWAMSTTERKFSSSFFSTKSLLNLIFLSEQQQQQKQHIIRYVY